MAEQVGAISEATSARKQEPAPKSNSPMRWLIIGGVLIVIVIGVFAWRYLDTFESTDDAQVDGHVNAVSSRVAGYITKVNVEDNQAVQQGAVLVEIDPRDYEAAVERAKAELADAEASAQAMSLTIPVETVGTSSQEASSAADLATAQAGVGAATNQLAVAKARQQEAEANSARAQADLARYQALVAKDEVSRQVFDQAQASARGNAAAVDSAKAAVAAAEQQVAAAQGKVSQADASVRFSKTGPQQVAATRARAQAALANVEQKRAALHIAQLNLQYCTVIAPVTGVARKNVEVGMNVQPGQSLLSIVPLDDVWVTANFKETQLRKMRPGQRVTIDVDAYSREYHGHVDSISGASGARFSLLPPENATGNYVKVVQRLPVKILLDPGENQDHLLRIGMSVEPKVWVQ